MKSTSVKSTVVTLSVKPNVAHNKPSRANVTKDVSLTNDVKHMNDANHMNGDPSRQLTSLQLTSIGNGSSTNDERQAFAKCTNDTNGESPRSQQPPRPKSVRMFCRGEDVAELEEKEEEHPEEDGEHHPEGGEHPKGIDTESMKTTRPD